MTDITYDKVRKYIGKYHMIEENDLIAAGVSGGADSVCLLHMLWRLQKEKRFRLLAVHVDHGVRMESAKDAAYVEQLCCSLNVPFYLRKVDMNGYAKREGLSPEEAGRLLRYEAFKEVLDAQKTEGESMKTAVAHNCNDRAETMLFHMFRGSGMKGLASIQPVRETVIRPLLCLERKEIEGYLAEHGLQYCQDYTNEEDAYTRNRIRHHILPYAEREICSGAVAHMGELAEIVSATEEYLEGQTKRLYKLYVEEIRTDRGIADRNYPDIEQDKDSVPVSLRIKGAALLSEDSVMYKRVLLACMERLTPHRKDITGKHINALVGLMTKDGSKEICLPYGIRVYKEYDQLYLIKAAKRTEPGAARMTDRTERIVGCERVIPGSDGEGSAQRGIGYACAIRCPAYKVEVPSEIIVPDRGTFIFSLLEKEAGFCEKEQNIPQNRYTKWFDYDKITTSLILRIRQQGDYLAVDAGMHTKSVKQYMINEKIPKMQRDRMYLLADGEHILWIPGYRISQGYKVDESTERILQVQFRGGSNGGTN